MNWIWPSFFWTIPSIRNIDSATMKETSFCFCTNSQKLLAKEKACHPRISAETSASSFHPGELDPQLFKKYAVTPKYNPSLQPGHRYATMASTPTWLYHAVSGSLCPGPRGRRHSFWPILPLTIAVVKKAGKAVLRSRKALQQYLSEHPDKQHRFEGPALQQFSYAYHQSPVISRPPADVAGRVFERFTVLERSIVFRTTCNS